MFRLLARRWSVECLSNRLTSYSLLPRFRRVPTGFSMTITLINRTNKAIVYGGIIFHFLDTGDCKSQPCAGTEIHFGQLPAVDAYYARTGKPVKNRGTAPLNWGPEQTFVVHVSEYIPQIEQSPNKFMPVTDVTGGRL